MLRETRFTPKAGAILVRCLSVAFPLLGSLGGCCRESIAQDMGTTCLPLVKLARTICISGGQQARGTMQDVVLTDTKSAVFTGKEPNRALALSSLKTEECVPEWEDLGDSEKKVLDDWYTFFSKRYNVVGKLVKEQSSNL
jgi:hypothetical protein